MAAVVTSLQQSGGASNHIRVALECHILRVQTLQNSACSGRWRGAHPAQADGAVQLRALLVQLQAAHHPRQLALRLVRLRRPHLRQHPPCSAVQHPGASGCMGECHQRGYTCRCGVPAQQCNAGDAICPWSVNDANCVIPGSSSLGSCCRRRVRRLCGRGCGSSTFGAGCSLLTVWELHADSRSEDHLSCCQA
jgi:hypothetical protein